MAREKCAGGALMSELKMFLSEGSQPRISITFPTSNPASCFTELCSCSGKNLLYIPYFKDCFGMNGLIPEIKCKDQRMWCVQECPTEQINFTLDALGEEGNIEKMICFANDKRQIEDSPKEQRKQKALEALNSAKCAEFIYPTKKSELQILL